MKSHFCLLFGLAIIISCASVSQPVIHVSSPFNEDEIAPFTKNGTSAIYGQAFLKTKGGDTKYGAGDTIYLIPSTTYTKELISKAEEKGGGFLTNADPRVKQYIRKTTADGEGRFEFINLPKGDYYVGCRIVWKVATGYGLAATGGNIYKFVSLKENDKAKIILTL
jgi:hypothetical protein